MEKLTKEQINEIINLAKKISEAHKTADKTWAPKKMEKYMEVARNNLICSLETILGLNDLYEVQK